VYLVKKKQHATAEITATQVTVLQVIRTVEGLGHKIFMDNCFTRLPCLMICSKGKSMRSEYFAMTGVKCQETLDKNLMFC
jgi:hypothetical protein